MMRLMASCDDRFLQANQYNVYYGGAEANVAVSLSHLDQETVHVSAFPDQDIGKAASNYLKANGVDTSHILFSAAGRMGLYFHEKGTMQRSSRIIYDRFDSSFSLVKASDFDWDAIFSDADWLHWTGITPAISESAAALCKVAIDKAKDKGLTISGDVNYRRNLWQYGKQPLDIMPDLISKTDVIIAGLTDFENCMDIKKEHFEEACDEACQRFSNIDIIASTRRVSISASHNNLSGIMYKNGEIFISKSYEMPYIIDRIGGGDAFMAGLIYGLLFKKDQEILEFAVAASVLKHAIHGDANLSKVEEIEHLLTNKNIGRLLR